MMRFTALLSFAAVVKSQGTCTSDTNGDNTVDAADYTVWRDNLGQSDLALNGNGSGDASGLVVQADYQLWRDNYGSSGILTAVPDPVPYCWRWQSSAGAH